MRLDFAARASAHALRHPRQSLERVRGRLDARADRQWLESDAATHAFDDVVPDPGHALHATLGVAEPCAAAEEFTALWRGIVVAFADAGKRVGLATYRGWNDGDRAMVAAVWCAVAHLRPEIVVETGVAHGLTSRVVLEGLARNGTGTLHSIDLPAVDTALHDEIGAAVPDRLRSRWTYLAGTSRDRLPALVREVAVVDLFVHDSLHTARNIRFELATVWPVLRPGGLVIVDDVHRSNGFRSFVEDTAPPVRFEATHALGTGMWGVAAKKSTPVDGGDPSNARTTFT